MIKTLIAAWMKRLIY